MNRLVSEIIGRGVIVRQETALVGHIQEIVINPDDGVLMGFIVKEGFGKQKLKAVSEKNVLGINEKFVLISAYGAMGEITEFVRISAINKLGIKIMNCKVETISGSNLGKVVDYSIDFKLGKLSRLYVNPKGLRRLAKQYVIDSKSIIKIGKNKITVDDTVLRVKKKENPKLVQATKELTTN